MYDACCVRCLLLFIVVYFFDFYEHRVYYTAEQQTLFNMKNSKLRKCSVISYEAKCTGWRVVESFFVPRQKDRLNEDAFLCMEIYIGISCRSLLHTLQKNLFLFVKACCTVLYRVLCFYISQSIINTVFCKFCVYEKIIYVLHWEKKHDRMKTC